MTRFRVLAEGLGVALYLAAHVPLAVIYALGSSLDGVQPGVYWTALGAGYVAMVVLAVARPAPLGRLPRRAAFDAWLVAAVPALAIVAVSVSRRWPLALAGWDGHGLGASGGEVNAVLFPILHGLLWLLAAQLTRQGQRA
jgi:hypothetical protein